MQMTDKMRSAALALLKWMSVPQQAILVGADGSAVSSFN